MEGTRRLLERITEVMEYLRLRGANKESVNKVYRKILSLKYGT